MSAIHSVPAPVNGSARRGPQFVYQADFEAPDAEQRLGGVAKAYDHSQNFMPDEILRDLARRMHYAAWRAQQAKSGRSASRWLQRYYDCRNCIVMGNRKLTYRAVSKWGAVAKVAEDMASECHIVLIKAVAGFNPWLNIRFSTYAFTCLTRALSRLTQRLAADRLTNSLNLESAPEGETLASWQEELENSDAALVRSYFRPEASTLTEREKYVLTRRFRLGDEPFGDDTLEQVGRALGISKERTRQLQKSALDKLRHALVPSQSIQ
jgi:RNA polymerase sigma factor (sigma-70 family)